MIQITSNSGVPFNVRIVFIGDHYGLRDCLTHGLKHGSGQIDEFSVEHGPMIEFYDARFINNDAWKRGQFVTRYFVDSLLDRKDGVGLTLDGGCEGWWLDAKAFEIAMMYAECKIAHRKWKEAHK